MNKKEHFHGSDLSKIKKKYNIEDTELISFSDNVNPLGISPKLREHLIENIDSISHYPERDYCSLRESISDYCRVNIDNIFLGNGASELISVTFRVLNPKGALVIQPTYSEYERVLRENGAIVKYFELKEIDDFKLNTTELLKELSNNFDCLIICNPNNPTASFIDTNTMKEILNFCEENTIQVVIDETYIEFLEPDVDSAVILIDDYDNLIVLRGISKFFASPGLRLGFGLTGNNDYIESFNEHHNPWSINTLASIGGQVMFSDAEYINSTRDYIVNERVRIISRLNECSSIYVYPSYTNFILIKIIDSDKTANDMLEIALNKGFLIRDCSSFEYLNENYFRFCLNKKELNDQLVDLILDTFE